MGGTPNPVVSWRRDGETISGNNPRISCVDGNRRLLIRNLTVQDAGVYTCVVRNQHGEVSRSSRVVVQGIKNFLHMNFYTELFTLFTFIKSIRIFTNHSYRIYYNSV